MVQITATVIEKAMPTGKIQTKFGDIEIEFFPDVAPKHVENFKKLASTGFFDGTLFHRIVPGFVIQGGDPLTKSAANKARWGTGGPGWSVKAEFNKTKHTRGVLSMARSRDPN
ncbi:MAG: peptidylprolyl isomerase, partial [Nitrososphaera sp.]